MKALERRLGLPSVIAISMGAMLGSGLFVLPGIAFAGTGPSVWLAYLIAGLAVLPAALSKAELATAMPVSGGSYVYLDRTFGPLASTIAGLGLWFSLLLKSAFALVGFGKYLEAISPVPILPVGLGLLTFIAGLNIIGIRKVGKAQTWVVGICLVALGILCAWGLTVFDVERLEPSFTQGGSGFLATVSLVYISYAGVTKVAAIAEEVKKPGKNLPLGILLSLAIVSLVYVGVTLSLVGVVPADELSGDLHPLYTMAYHVGGPGLAIAGAVLGVVTMTSMANAGLLAASRFPFAMSRDNLLPPVLSRVNDRFLTPIPAILLTALLMAFAILFLDVPKLAKLASALMIGGFMAVNLSVLVLRESSAQWYKPQYRAPFYPYTQIAGLLIGAILLVVLGWLALFTFLGTAALGVTVYFAYGRPRANRTGVLGQMGRRKDLVAVADADIDTVLDKAAAVVVPILGRETSPETLVELGAALSGGSTVEVVHITYIPEQVMLDAMLDEGAGLTSLRRRIGRLAANKRHDVEVDAVVTRDPGRTVHTISNRVASDWIVMEWQGKADGGFLARSPLGWLLEHLSCNVALFRDAGVRAFAELLVFAEPGPHDALVVRTADQLATIYDSAITFVRVVPINASTEERYAATAYLEQLENLCERPAQLRVESGSDRIRTLIEITASYDLLILGAPPERRLRDVLFGTAIDHLTEKSACSVLHLRTPRSRTHAVLQGREFDDKQEPKLSEFVVPGCSAARLKPMNKTALFAYFARSFCSAIQQISAAEVENALWKRERAQNTAVGRGMALPHATVEAATGTYLGVFTLREAIDYKAPDGKPVDVFVVTIGPASERATHLRVLAHLATLVIGSDLLDRLRAAENDRELLEVLSTARKNTALPASENNGSADKNAPSTPES